MEEKEKQMEGTYFDPNYFEIYNAWAEANMNFKIWEMKIINAMGNNLFVTEEPSCQCECDKQQFLLPL
jgi:hypothetical protein